jgi:hypothetical protein
VVGSDCTGAKARRRDWQKCGVDVSWSDAVTLQQRACGAEDVPSRVASTRHEAARAVQCNLHLGQSVREHMGNGCEPDSAQ